MSKKVNVRFIEPEKINEEGLRNEIIKDVRIGEVPNIKNLSEKYHVGPKVVSTRIREYSKDLFGVVLKPSQKNKLNLVRDIKDHLRLTMYEYDCMNQEEVTVKIIQILTSLNEDIIDGDFNMLVFEVKKRLMGMI